MIDTEEHGPVTVLRMAYGKANALDVELCRHLTGAVRAHGLAPSRALVITGDGRIFSAGADLRRIPAGGAAYAAAFLAALCELYETLFFHPKPVVAAVNGHAIGGGCVLACCADRRIMAEPGGRIGITELHVGVPFPTVALEVMRAVTAPHRFATLVTSGVTCGPAEALDLGLVDEIDAPGRIMERAIACAGSLAGLSQVAFELSKRQLREPARRRMRTDAPRFDAEVLAVWQLPEALARMRDYIDGIAGPM